MQLGQPPLELVLDEAFWPDALAPAGHREARVLRRWRSRRYEYAQLQVGRLRWLGSAAIADAPAPLNDVSTAASCANEAAALGRLASGGHETGVLSPALLAHGTHAGRTFIVRQWIEGSAAACSEDELVTVCEGLRHYRTQPLPLDFAEKWAGGRRPGINQRIATVASWAEQIRDHADMSKLLAIVQDPPDGIQVAFSHGDFVPANLLRNVDGLWLVDFERAAAMRAEFYDVAYCYFSLRTEPSSLFPGGFAVAFRKRLRFRERRGFRQAFRWHLAALIVEGYRRHFLGGGMSSQLNLDLLSRDVVRKDLPV
jgi:hypothetical protein